MAPLFKNKTAEPFFVTMPYEEAQQKVAIKLSTHVGQELDIILKGAMKVQVGNHIEVLHEGDSIYYNSATPHGMIAHRGRRVPVLRHRHEGRRGVRPGAGQVPAAHRPEAGPPR